MYYGLVLLQDRGVMFPREFLLKFEQWARSKDRKPLVVRGARQELIAMQTNTRKKQCFWVREKSQSQAKIDFLVQYKGYVIPVEVKSGKTGKLRSLHQFMDRCPHLYVVRMYAGHL
jgi:penicillin-binding protein-related factor A (putative recombinase)